jgi:23S rRNA pseudouridine1911/1915/1917 synthase
METYTVQGLNNLISVTKYLKTQKISSSEVKKIKRLGTLLINNKAVAASALVKNGDIVCYKLPTNLEKVSAEFYNLEIKYEDEFLIIVNKPAGIVIHPTTSNFSGTLSNYLAYYYKSKNEDSGIHAVSRLDKNTSGLVLFAKKANIQYLLTTTKLNKEYLAFVEGSYNEKSGTINLPIARKPNSIIERMVDCHAGKCAYTEYKQLQTYSLKKEYKNLSLPNIISLIKFKLLTGRTHQIRVHSAYLNHPLVNDNLYGNPGPQSRHSLHSYKLSFIHPKTNKLISCISQLPNDLTNIINKYNKLD